MDVLQIENEGYCRGVENYARHLARRKAGEPPDCLIDYFPPEEWLLVVDESHISVPQVRGMYYGDRMRKETLVQHGFRLPSALDNRPLQEEEFWARVPQCLFVSATPGAWELQQTAVACKNRAQGAVRAQEAVIEMVIRPTGILDPVVVTRPSHGQVDDLVAEIADRLQRHERCLVTTLTKRSAEEVFTFVCAVYLSICAHAYMYACVFAGVDLSAGVWAESSISALRRQGVGSPCDYSRPACRRL